MTVSRVEQHHVDAFADAGSDWQERARDLLADRAAGVGFGLVAVRDEAPVGLVGVHSDEDGWRLHGLGVVPPARGQDVERYLVTAVEELGRPLGSLRADVEDDSARQVLLQLGWTEVAGGYARQFG